MIRKLMPIVQISIDQWALSFDNLPFRHGGELAIEQVQPHPYVGDRAAMGY